MTIGTIIIISVSSIKLHSVAMIFLIAAMILFIASPPKVTTPRIEAKAGDRGMGTRP
jgi:hypothetical protein